MERIIIVAFSLDLLLDLPQDYLRAALMDQPPQEQELASLELERRPERRHQLAELSQASLVSKLRALLSQTTQAWSPQELLSRPHSWRLPPRK